MKNVRRIGIVVFVVIGVLLAGPWVLPWALQGPQFNGRRAEINIKTGQACYTRWLWCVKVSQRVEDTVLSQALAGEAVEAADVEPWYTVYTSWPGQRVFRYTAYHGALAQANALHAVFRLYESDAGRQREIVRQVLTLWQTHGDCFEADNYIRSLDRETAGPLQK